MSMTEFSSTEQTILVQYGIKKYENEEIVFEKLKTIMSEKYIRFGYFLMRQTNCHLHVSGLKATQHFSFLSTCS